MMPIDMPPAPPAWVCPASAVVSAADAAKVLRDMRGKLPGTVFVEASPAPLCGMVTLTTDSGNTLFTDKSGRYFVVGLMLDTATGRTLDETKQLNRD